MKSCVCLRAIVSHCPFVFISHVNYERQRVVTLPRPYYVELVNHSIKFFSFTSFSRLLHSDEEAI